MKTRKFIIATHGTLSHGAKASLEMIVGKNENIKIIQAYLTENKSIENELHILIENLATESELIIFTDIMGGSVTNQTLKCSAQKDNIHLIAGFNLPLLIEITMADINDPIKKIITEAIHNAKEQIIYINDLINTKKNNDD